METRIDKYNNKNIPTRVEKNKELYTKIYSAYDEFENYKIPIDSNEVDLSNVKRNVTSREEYRQVKNYSSATNSKIVKRDPDVYKVDFDKNTEVYDVKDMIKEAKDARKTEINEEKEENYLKKLNLDLEKTNLEKMKEMYTDVTLSEDEEEKLSNTANLSLEILSDLKGDNENTVVTDPIQRDDDVINEDKTFYSNNYSFKNEDFFESDEEIEEKDNKYLFKIILIILFIILLAIISIYFIGYFGRT